MELHRPSRIPIRPDPHRSNTPPRPNPRDLARTGVGHRNIETTLQNPKEVGRESLRHSAPSHPPLDHFSTVAFGNTAIGPHVAFSHASANEEGLSLWIKQVYRSSQIAISTLTKKQFCKGSTDRTLNHHGETGALSAHADSTKVEFANQGFQYFRTNSSLKNSLCP